MRYHNYIAVTGRIHGDDEDSCYTFQHMTQDEALEAFRTAIRDDREQPESEVYTNFVLASDSPIEILAWVFPN